MEKFSGLDISMIIDVDTSTSKSVKKDRIAQTENLQPSNRQKANHRTKMAHLAFSVNSNETDGVLELGSFASNIRLCASLLSVVCCVPCLEG